MRAIVATETLADLGWPGLQFIVSHSRSKDCAGFSQDDAAAVRCHVDGSML